MGTWIPMGTRYMGTGHMGTWYRVHGTEYMGTEYYLLGLGENFRFGQKVQTTMWEVW